MAKCRKCEIDSANRTVVKTCFGLEQALNVCGSRTGGVSLITLINTKTGLQRELVVLRSGEHKKNGLVINNCPFCGVDMTSLFELDKSRKVT